MSELWWLKQPLALTLGLLSWLAVGTVPAISQSSPRNDSPRVIIGQIPLGFTLATLKNSTYTLPDQSTYTLSGGVSSQNGKTLTLIPPVAVGDLSQDGVAEAVVILSLDQGAAGTFIYLALMLSQQGQLQNVDTYELGDRVRVQSLSLKNNQVRVTLLKHQASDPLCCPSELVVQAYQLNDSGELAPLTLSAQERQQIHIEDLPVPDVANDDDFPDQPALGEFKIRL
jgi:hypothetical protein